MATSTETNDTIRDTADQVGKTARKVGDTIRENLENAQQFAKEKFEAASGYAADEALHDLSDFVRAQPWLALGVAFMVGYVAAKVLKKVA
jgi:ElaB/YqjD/DUF883 family membrane-anchored ribosome-binding protein